MVFHLENQGCTYIVSQFGGNPGKYETDLCFSTLFRLKGVVLYMQIPLLALQRVQTGSLWSHASLAFLQASQAARRDIAGLAEFRPVVEIKKSEVG